LPLVSAGRRRTRGGGGCGLAAAALLLAAAPAHGFGPFGHRVAGLLAARFLCDGARAQIARLGDGQGLDSLGLWADRIRSDPRWDKALPWHYMNVGDHEPIEARRIPREGDVLWAVEHFLDQLADDGLPERVRADALRFAVHFIVDVHQPLHVGRESDHGGNTIDVRLGSTDTNLHKFWDTDVLRLEGVSAERYARELVPLARLHEHEWAAAPPLAWAEESQRLRPRVYALPRGGRLDERYLRGARRIAKKRLAQAAVRLAASLNHRYCPMAEGSRPR
jgi:hypothetical protein